MNVVGDDGTTLSLLSSKGPHDHDEPTPKQLKLAGQSDVVFAVGLGLERMNARLKSAAGKPDLNLIELGEGLDKTKLLEGVCHHDHKPGEEHDHGFDHHVWLSPRHARSMVAAIRDEMKRIDPTHAANYDARAAAYIAKLDKLEKDGFELLKDKKERRIIAFHDSLRYLGETFGITIADFIQPEPGIDPDGKLMKKIIQVCKDQKIRLIAVEPQYPRNTSAATILRELRDAGIDAEFVEIDPLETADEADLTPDLYEKKMRANLENLAKALR